MNNCKLKTKTNLFQFELKDEINEDAYFTFKSIFYTVLSNQGKVSCSMNWTVILFILEYL